MSRMWYKFVSNYVYSSLMIHLTWSMDFNYEISTCPNIYVVLLDNLDSIHMFLFKKILNETCSFHTYIKSTIIIAKRSAINIIKNSLCNTQEQRPFSVKSPTTAAAAAAAAASAAFYSIHVGYHSRWRHEELQQLRQQPYYTGYKNQYVTFNTWLKWISCTRLRMLLVKMGLFMWLYLPPYCYSKQ